MSFTISKTISTAFPNGMVDPERLYTEVLNSPISSAVLESINVDTGADNCDAIWDVEPSNPDKTSYDNIVATHSGMPFTYPAELVSLGQDHFMSSNTDTDEIGNLGWRQTTSGSGSDLDIRSEPGYPGIIVLEPGTSTNGYASIYLGSTATGHTVKLGGLNDITMDALIKIEGSVGAGDFDFAMFGLMDDNTSVNMPSNSVGLYFDPTESPNFQLKAVNATVETNFVSTVPFAINTWYRVGLRMYDLDTSPKILEKTINSGYVK